MNIVDDAPEKIDHLADLLALSARSVRWLAQLRATPDAARLRSIADDIDKAAGRLRQESPRSDARVH